MTVTTTHLQMLSPDEIRPKRCGDPHFQIRQATVPQWQVNRFLYQFVGGPWQWCDYLRKTDDEWRALTETDDLLTFIAYWDGSPAGYYELRRENGDIEIWHFGLAPAFLGRGLGGALLTSALEEAWKLQPRRVWVHTCTKDHPAALANYQARGLKVYHVDSEEEE